MKFLLSPFSGGNLSVVREKQLEALTAVNEKTEKLGLSLSPSDCQMLLDENSESLKTLDRIEFCGCLVAQIAEKFSQSSYISQRDYADSIAALIDIFYEAKDDGSENVGDEALIDALFDCFERFCGGSLELLSEKGGAICRALANGERVDYEDKDGDESADEDESYYG